VEHLRSYFTSTQKGPLLSVYELQIKLRPPSFRAEIMGVLLQVSEGIPWPPLRKVHPEFHWLQLGVAILRWGQVFMTELPHLLAGSNEPTKKEYGSDGFKKKSLIWKASTLCHQLSDICSSATKFPPSGCLAECPVSQLSYWTASDPMISQAKSWGWCWGGW